MRKEDRLILSILRTKQTEDELTQIEALLKENLDWNYFLKKSEEEGLSCLIYQYLKDLPLIKDNLLAPFKNSYYTNSLRNTFIYEEIKKILEIFNQEKIKIIILKGIFLAKNIYKNIALRPMTDVDFLIKKEDIIRANKILNSLGYFAVADIEEVIHQPYAYSLTFLKQNQIRFNNFSLDLHWHILSSSWLVGFLKERVDMERIFMEADLIKLVDTPVLTLSSEDLLIYLTQHVFAHNFKKLIMSIDIIETFKQYQDKIEEKRLKEKAKEYGLLNILDYALYFSALTLGINLEKNLCFNRKFKKRLFYYFGKLKINLHPAVIYLFLQDGLKEKLNFLRKLFFLYLHRRIKSKRN